VPAGEIQDVGAAGKLQQAPDQLDVLLRPLVGKHLCVEVEVVLVENVLEVEARLGHAAATRTRWIGPSPIVW
jgi:hypothetical protein